MSMQLTVALAALQFLSTSQAEYWPTDPISLVGTLTLGGKRIERDVVDSKGVALVFVAVECPIANRYAPEIKRIVKDYESKGILFFRVYMEPLENANLIKKHSQDYGFSIPVLLDPEKKLAKKIGARITPEIALFDTHRKLIYRGRIDDQNIEHGKVRPNYRRDFRIALDELLAGKAISVPSTAAVGCFIGN